MGRLAVEAAVSRRLIPLVPSLAVVVLAAIVVALPLWILPGSLSSLLSWQPQQTQEEFEKDLARMRAVGIWRGAAKTYVRGEMLQDRITLMEALAWHHWINDQSVDWPIFYPKGYSPERWTVQDLLWGCQSTPADSSPDVLVRARRAEAQLRRLLDAHEALKLPELPHLPGMPPWPPSPDSD